jgi:hypothetical protein
VYNQPAADFTYQYPPDPSHWIEIDPIPNFQMGVRIGFKQNYFQYYRDYQSSC